MMAGRMSFCDTAIGHARPAPVQEGMYRAVQMKNIGWVAFYTTNLYELMAQEATKLVLVSTFRTFSRS